MAWAYEKNGKWSFAKKAHALKILSPIQIKYLQYFLLSFKWHSMKLKYYLIYLITMNHLLSFLPIEESLTIIFTNQ